MPWAGEKMLQRARDLWARPDERQDAVVFAEDIASAVTREECAKLAELARGKRVLEVGSYLGRSTIALASTAAVVHSVDVHPPEPEAEPALATTAGAFIENLDKYGMRHKVVAHIGFSQLILRELPPRSFDVVFIDAQHHLEAVREDIHAILPLVKDDGVFAFHDYGVPGIEHQGVWDPFGVTEAVTEFAEEHGLPVEITGTVAVVRLPG